MQTETHVVVSLGGSLIVPNEVDASFLSSFRSLVLSYVERGFSFAIAVGGGKTCRRYQAAGRDVTELTKDELDWIGIHINRMHAEFLRVLFGEKAAPFVVNDFSAPLPTEYPIIMVGAAAPGHSSDYDAVLVAESFNARTLINLSNIDYVYDKDPKIFSDAKKIENITWPKFRELLPTEWDPGFSSPFDPIAAKRAEEAGLEVAIINGTALSEIEKCLNNEPFAGTVVHS
jgi:uridylate kinase